MDAQDLQHAPRLQICTEDIIGYQERGWDEERYNRHLQEEAEKLLASKSHVIHAVMDGIETNAVRCILVECYRHFGVFKEETRDWSGSQFFCRCMELISTIIALGLLRAGPRCEDTQSDNVMKTVSWRSITVGRFLMAIALNRDLIRRALNADGSYTSPVYVNTSKIKVNTLAQRIGTSGVQKVAAWYFNSLAHATEDDIIELCPAPTLLSNIYCDTEGPKNARVAGVQLEGDYASHVELVDSMAITGHDMASTLRHAMFIYDNPDMPGCCIASFVDGDYGEDDPLCVIFFRCMLILFQGAAEYL